MIGLLELLSARGFLPNRRRVKLVRHKDVRFDLEELLRSGQLELYQQFQGSPIFDGCEQIVAFIGEDGAKSRFVGVSDVGQRQSAGDTKAWNKIKRQVWIADAQYWYPTTHRPEFMDLENRLVIDWGRSPRSWHQWFSDRNVLEIRPEGRTLPPFRDYLKVHLSFQELKDLARTPDAHRDWVAGLTAVGGVYLIVSTLTGEQYVGSATGEHGIWQRWLNYADTGHCGNARLLNLCKTDPRHPDKFMFSILEVFSRTTAKSAAVAQETFFKNKLGSRAFGLNDN